MEAYRPGQWQRITKDALETALKPSNLVQTFVLGWRVNLPAGSVQMDGVDHLILAIDGAYPNSQPRIIVPNAGSDFRWPHVEPGGVLCLRSSRCAAPTGDRVAVHLDDAQELLNYSEEERRADFEREFIAYWGHRATSVDRARVVSLVSPGGITREIYYFYDPKIDRFVAADDKAGLKKWLANLGLNPGDKQIYPTWLFRLSQPWTPQEYPEYGRDITGLLPEEIVRHCLVPGMRSPFLFEAETATGTAIVAVILRGAEQREVIKGFRHISRVPVQRIINAYANRPVERCKVSRVDGAWVHGRDHPSSHAEIKGRAVAIIGCGAIGSAVARLLAQSGVGELILVDGDFLSSANASRHQLGIAQMAQPKATALQTELRKQFPHLIFRHAFKARFEELSTKELAHLARADLIISAGIDFDGEAALDAWRGTLAQPPAHLSTWVEAYAAAGHAVLLYGSASLLSGFDEQERPDFRLSDWPDEAGALIVEAGCGNSFQPHGMIDLHPTIGLAASLAMDTLLDKIPTSCRRVWMGDPSVVVHHGGILRDAFTDKLTIREFPWS